MPITSDSTNAVTATRRQRRAERRLCAMYRCTQLMPASSSCLCCLQEELAFGQRLPRGEQQFGEAGLRSASGRLPPRRVRKSHQVFAIRGQPLDQARPARQAAPRGARCISAFLLRAGPAGSTKETLFLMKASTRVSAPE